MTVRTQGFAALALVASIFVAASCNGKMVVDDNTAQRWMGNAPSCPSVSPQRDTPCSVDEGQICAWWYTEPYGNNPAYDACRCTEVSGGTTSWYCYGLSSGVGLLACPTIEPESGSSCEGAMGAMCPFPPRTTCSCPSEGDEPTWACAPPFSSLPDHGSGVPPTTPIDELSDAQRQTWCEWYSLAKGPAVESPLTADGYTINTGCNFEMNPSASCTAAAPTIPVSYCIGNLRLSSCGAPISELEDCMLTLLDGCWPSTHGCARYLDHPECDGTMVRARSPLGQDAPDAGSVDASGHGWCSVKVE